MALNLEVLEVQVVYSVPPSQQAVPAQAASSELQPTLQAAAFSAQRRQVLQRSQRALKAPAAFSVHFKQLPPRVLAASSAHNRQAVQIPEAYSVQPRPRRQAAQVQAVSSVQSRQQAQAAFSVQPSPPRARVLAASSVVLQEVAQASSQHRRAAHRLVLAYLVHQRPVREVFLELRAQEPISSASQPSRPSRQLQQEASLAPVPAPREAASSVGRLVGSSAQPRVPPALRGPGTSLAKLVATSSGVVLAAPGPSSHPEEVAEVFSANPPVQEVATSSEHLLQVPPPRAACSSSGRRHRHRRAHPVGEEEAFSVSRSRSRALVVVTRSCSARARHSRKDLRTCLDSQLQVQMLVLVAHLLVVLHKAFHHPVQGLANLRRQQVPSAVSDQLQVQVDSALLHRLPAETFSRSPTPAVHRRGAGL